MLLKLFESIDAMA